MSTTTKTRNVANKVSSDIFPQSVRVLEESLVYVKRLTAVAISNILYLRNVFSEECYGHRKLDNIKLRILSERSSTEAATQIVGLVKGCYDALEHKYLRQLILGIFTDPENSDQLIESYTFSFNYTNDNRINISLNDQTLTDNELISSDKQLHESTQNLLKSIITLTSTLDKLPEECYLTMKLLYFDQITPENYEPPGFMAAKTDSFNYDGNPISIDIGEVSTPFHTLKLKIRANNSQSDDNSMDSGSQGDSELMDYSRDKSNARISARIPNRIDSVIDNLNEKPKQSVTKQKQIHTSDESIVTSKIKRLNVSDSSSKTGFSKRKILSDDSLDLETQTFHRNTNKSEKKFKASVSKANFDLGKREGF